MTQPPKTQPLEGFDQHEREPVRQTYPRLRVFLELDECGHVVVEKTDIGRKIGQVVVCPECPPDAPGRRIKWITRTGRAKDEPSAG